MSERSPAEIRPHVRSLTPAEARLLSARVGDLQRRSGGARSVLLVTGAVTLLLWLVTVLASDAPLWVVSLFWLIVGTALALWVRRDATRDARAAAQMAASLESARRSGRAEVYDVRATRFVEFEEAEDEGACYAFEIADRTLLFVTGQAFYPSARFPSLDFSLVYPLDEKGEPVDMWISKRGDAVPPHRVIPASSKWDLEIPEHLTVIRADLVNVEDALES